MKNFFHLNVPHSIHTTTQSNECKPKSDYRFVNWHIRLLIAATTVTLWWSWTITEAQTLPDTLTVEGQVVNATLQAESSIVVTVVLHQNRLGSQNDLAKLTDSEGRFLFKDIVYDPEVLYGVSVIYQNALYGMDLDLSNGNPDHVTLTVYESSNSDTLLNVTSSSLLISQIDKTDQLIWGLEIIRVTNNTDRTYVPGAEPMSLLRFGLPPKAVDLQVDTSLTGSDLIQVDRGFALTGSVPPGNHEIMYSYRFPYEGNEATITKSYPYGAGQIRVMAPEGLIDLSSKGLGISELVTIGGRNYHLLPGSELPRGSQISITLTGLPSASVLEHLTRQIRILGLNTIIPTSLGLFLVALICFSLWNRKLLRRPALDQLSGEIDTNKDSQKSKNV